jgi:quinol-cytochrome oxidoreductase complex cytochrome b subunit
MTDSVYAPPKSDLSAPTTDSTAAFYVVSLTKMMVLFIATMGAYQLYWHYKNWRFHQQLAASTNGPDSEIWPVPRAIFSIFYIHSLLGKVKQHALNHNRPVTINTVLIATLIVALALLGLCGMLIRDPKLLVIFSVLGMCMLVPNMFLYRKAQGFINEACGDPAGDVNREFTTGNYVWIIIGVLIWLMQINGLVTLAKLV